MNIVARIVAIVTVLAFSQVVDAQTRSKIIDATDPEQIAATIRDLGYKARTDMEDDAYPAVFSSVGGTDFAIQFQTCDNGYSECRVLLFKVGYDLDDGTSLAAVNAFNEQTLIGRAYLDDENDPWLEWAVNLYGGVTRKNFEDTFDWWEIIVAQFEEHIGF